MLFFSSEANNYYGYDYGSNKIIKIPPKWKFEIDRGQQSIVVDHLRAIGAIQSINLEFRGPAADWHQCGNDIVSLVLNVTDACNLRCTYCAYSDHYPFERSHGSATMSFEVAKKTIDHYLQNSKNAEFRRVNFYGGEPLLARSLVKNVVAYTKTNASNVIFSLNTNALALSDSWIDYVSSENIQLHVSLDGPVFDHDRYRKDRRGRGTHEKVMQNLKRLADYAQEYYRNNVCFIATLTPPHQLLSLFKFYNDNELLRSQEWIVNFVKPMDTTFVDFAKSTNDTDYLSYDDQVKILAKDYIKSAISGNVCTHFGYWVFGDLLKKIHYRVMSPPADAWINGCCRPGVDKLFVDTHGNYYPCERSGGFMNIGNQFDGLLYDNVSGIISDFKIDCQNNCANCHNVRFCDTCYLASRRENHLELSRKYEYCPKRIAKLKQTLHVYVSVLEGNPHAFDVLART